MAGNPYLQNLDPQSPPDPVTPAASPSDPAGFAMVTPHGRGPAPYSIQDPAYTGGGLQAEVTAAFDSANAVEGQGVLYPQGPRQASTQAFMQSPAGYGNISVLEGFSGSGATDMGWPNDVRPPEAAYNEYTPGNTPGSPTGVPQGTTQPGIGQDDRF